MDFMAALQGVEREGGMGVEVAEEGLAQWVALGAGLAWNQIAGRGRRARRAPLLGDVVRGCRARRGVAALLVRLAASQCGGGRKAGFES